VARSIVEADDEDAAMEAAENVMDTSFHRERAAGASALDSDDRQVRKTQIARYLIRSGGVELVNMSAAYFGADLPLFTAPNSIPMAMTEVPHATSLIQRLLSEVPAMDEEAKRNGVRALFFHHLNPYLLVCKEPIKGIADIKGKKIRTWGSDMPRMVQAAGGVPVTLGLAELYEGLSRGTVDCIPFSVDLMVSYKIQEVAKHVHDITLWLGPTSAVWMSRGAWDKLAPDLQKVMDEVSKEAAIRDRDLTIAAAKTATEQLEAAGVTFHAFPEALGSVDGSAAPHI